MFQKNVGTTDRTIRGIVGALLVLAYLLGWTTGTLGVILLIVGAVLLGTAALGTCPPYAMLGINTCKLRNQ